MFSSSSMYLVLHCIKKQEPIYTVQCFLTSATCNMNLVWCSYECIEVLRHVSKLYNWYLHATVVSKLYCVNLSQAKRNWNSNSILRSDVFNFGEFPVAISILSLRIIGRIISIPTKCSVKFISHNLLKSLHSRILHVQMFCLYFAVVTPVQISLIFPPKDLEKYGRSKYACANFFKIFKWFQLVNLCLNIKNFPAKRLGKKIRSPKIRMRRIFYFFIATFY